MLPPTDGWLLLQLADLLRASERHADVALRGLHGVDGDLTTDADIVVERAHVENIRAATAELAQFAQRAAQLAEALAGDIDIGLDYMEVAAAAAEDLADGIFDPDRARLAARVLHVHDGWPALATALRETDAHASWNGITVAELLGSFRDVSPHLIRRVATSAGLAPGAELSACDPDEIARLAARLDEHFGGPA